MGNVSNYGIYNLATQKLIGIFGQYKGGGGGGGGFTNTYSLAFDGVDDYVDCGSGLDIFQYNIGQSYTVSLWYKSRSSTSFDTIVNFGSNTYKFSLVTGLNGTISFGAGNSTSITYVNKWLPTSGVINDGQLASYMYCSR